MPNSDHTAAESALGYLYQAEFALLEFIKRSRSEPSLRLSLEVFDDITFEHDGGPKDLLQTKHHINSRGSLSDASVDLWKTLGGWIDASRSDIAGFDVLTLSLITTTAASEESAAASLRAVDRDVSRALGILERTAQVSTNVQNQDSYEKFLGLSPDQRLALLGRVVVMDSAMTIVDIPGSLVPELRFAVAPRYLHALVDRLIGWWHNRVIKHFLTDGDRILTEEVDSEIRYLADLLRSDNLPIDIGVDDVTIEELENDDRVFIHQLQLIAAARPTLELAIRDYKRAYLQRSKWLEDQLVWPSELRTYEQRLIDEWEHQFAFIGDGSTQEESDLVEVGRSLYQTLQNENLWIRPRCQERFVPRGSFHMLSDELKVGWHPKFIERLRELLSEDAG
ncbi:MAG: hypothetical protein QOG54_2716 [Actinomycetota bacterium]|jgi:hypothetical protein|nr:hypothetical protein [Actinomycetota bacterium]